MYWFRDHKFVFYTFYDVHLILQYSFLVSWEDKLTYSYRIPSMLPHCQRTYVCSNSGTLLSLSFGFDSSSAISTLAWLAPPLQRWSFARSHRRDRRGGRRRSWGWGRWGPPPTAGTRSCSSPGSARCDRMAPDRAMDWWGPRGGTTPRRSSRPSPITSRARGGATTSRSSPAASLWYVRWNSQFSCKNLPALPCDAY